MEFKLRIIIGSEVLTLLRDEAFLSTWVQLANKDNKVTFAQKPGFVTTWYKEYASRYNPVLCLAYDGRDELIGLMALAKSTTDGTITHAGAHQAEYHGWIADPAIDQDFPIECLIRLKDASKKKTWQWRWLPPKTSANWLSSQLLANAGIYVSLRTQSSPVWDLSDNRLYEKMLKIKSVKNQMNRYKARGRYYIERIRGKERTRELMDILRVQYDFRQEAIYNKRPFAHDPFKASFYIERQNHPNDNHFCVLWSNGKPIAFHFGACDKDTVYLELSAYDPIESKNSPGTLLLIEIRKILLEEGYRYLDLTPGGDPYKERFANAYQNLVQPKFYFNKEEKIKDDITHQVKSMAKKALWQVGIGSHRKRDLEISVKSVRRITLAESFQKIMRLIYENSTYSLYRLLTETIENNKTEDSEINVQKYADLLGYTGSNPGVTRRDLCSEALKRFSAEDTLYSITKEGILVHYGWMSKRGTEHRFPEVDAVLNSGLDGIRLYDSYTEPEFRRQGLFQRNLKKMVRDARERGAKEVYIAISHDDLSARCAIEKIGFSLLRTFSRRRFLWISKRKECALENHKGGEDGFDPASELRVESNQIGEWRKRFPGELCL